MNDRLYSPYSYSIISYIIVVFIADVVLLLCSVFSASVVIYLFLNHCLVLHPGGPNLRAVSWETQLSSVAGLTSTAQNYRCSYYCNFVEKNKNISSI